MVIEPRATTRGIFETYLTAAGAEVVCIDDPRSALDAIEKAAEAGRPSRLQSSTSSLVEIDGIVLGETIRGTPSLFDTRIVLTNAADQSGLRKKALDRGIDAYLPKPVRRDMLVRAVMGEAPDVVRRAASPAPGVGGNILVAEDNPTNRAVVTRQLAQARIQP